MKDEDFAYEQLRQKRIDNMEKKATDPCELERKILDSNVAKNEAEWWARERIEELEQQLAEREKQIVLLREALKYLHDEKCDYMLLNKLGNPLEEHSAILALKALDATQDLSDLVLCDAEPVRHIYKFVWYDGSEVWRDKPTCNGTTATETLRLYKARKQP